MRIRIALATTILVALVALGGWALAQGGYMVIKGSPSGDQLYVQFFNGVSYSNVVTINSSGVFLSGRIAWNGTPLTSIFPVRSYVDNNIVGNRSEAISISEAYARSLFSDLKSYVDTNIASNASATLSTASQWIEGNFSALKSYADSNILGNVTSLNTSIRSWVSTNYYNKTVIDSWNLIKNYTLLQNLDANGHIIANASSVETANLVLSSSTASPDIVFARYSSSVAGINGVAIGYVGSSGTVYTAYLNASGTAIVPKACVGSPLLKWCSYIGSSSNLVFANPSGSQVASMYPSGDLVVSRYLNASGVSIGAAGSNLFIAATSDGFDANYSSSPLIHYFAANRSVLLYANLNIMEPYSVAVEGWDAVYKAYDRYAGTWYELIGVYHGWSNSTIYIAAYNYYFPRNGNPQLSYAKEVAIGRWSNGTSPVIINLNPYGTWTMNVTGNIFVTQNITAKYINAGDLVFANGWRIRELGTKALAIVDNKGRIVAIIGENGTTLASTTLGGGVPLWLAIALSIAGSAIGSATTAIIMRRR